MKEYVKAYNMFLAGRYMKYLIYLLMPVFVIGFSAVMISAAPVQELVMPVTAICMFWGEIMLQGKSFRAIAKKKNYNLEYIKTSAKWKRLLFKALVFDGIRRFISTSFILSAVFLLFKTAAGTETESVTAAALPAYILLTCFFCTVFLGVMKRTENVYASLAVIYFGVIPFWLAERFLNPHLGSLSGMALWAALFVAVTVFDIWHIIKRIGGSFYDE